MPVLPVLGPHLAAQKQDCNCMEDVRNLRFSKQSPHLEAGRTTMGIMVLEFGMARRNCLRSEAPP